MGHALLLSRNREKVPPINAPAPVYKQHSNDEKRMSIMTFDQAESTYRL
jgi:hypothetical protein